MKAAELYEMNGKYSDALKLYQQIKDEYPGSNEGSSIDKYIEREKLMYK